MVIGMLEDAAFEEQTIQLERGDILVAFSDGITEARDMAGEEFGEERLIACVQTHRRLSPSALLHRLFEEVHHFSARGTQADDLTVLVLNYSGGTGEPLTPQAG